MLDISFGKYKKALINDLKDFIKIKSVKGESTPNMPYGKEISEALNYIQTKAERMELSYVDLSGHLGYVDYGDGDEMLGILVHIDVVPAGEGWTVPSFEGIEKDGKIFGRGASDNKGPALSALYAINALCENSVHLNKKVRLIFGTDQETTWADMVYYKEHARMPDFAFSPDGQFPVINAEKGLVRFLVSKKISDNDNLGIKILDINAGIRPNVVPDTATCIVEASYDDLSERISNYECPIGCEFSINKTINGNYEILVGGTSAHGAYPQNGKNALASLITFLDTLPLASGDFEDSIKKIAEKIGVHLHGEGIDLNVSDDITGKLTCNMGMIFVKDNKLTFSVDIRFPIKYTQNFVLNAMEKNLGDFFEVKIVHTLPSHYMPENSLLVKQLSKAYEDVTGEKAYCMSISSATYAREFRNAVTFGALFPGRANVEHSADEFVYIDDLVKTTEIIANAIVNICNETID